MNKAAMDPFVQPAWPARFEEAFRDFVGAVSPRLSASSSRRDRRLRHFQRSCHKSTFSGDIDRRATAASATRYHNNKALWGGPATACVRVLANGEPAGVHSLLEYGPAGLAEAGLLPPQAGGDGPNVRDLAGAKPIDVGRAGPFLFLRSGFG